MALLMLPRVVLTHLKAGFRAALRPDPVMIGWWTQPALATPVKQCRPPGWEMASAILPFPPAERTWTPGRAMPRCSTRSVDNLERETEFCFELILPLDRHRRRGSNDDEIDPAPQQELTGDEPGLNRLAEADIVCNQK